jgi:hypothetical protein
VEDDGFWEGLEAVHFGGLPRLQDSVTVIGYPIGGRAQRRHLRLAPRQGWQRGAQAG